MYPFRKLKVWDKAHTLTVRVYASTDGPMSRKFPALGSQLRRAISAIPSNIAEGAGHVSQAQFARYLDIALASAREADYHLLLAKDLLMLSEREYAHLEARLGEVAGMLTGLRRRVRERTRESRSSPSRRTP